MPILEVNASPDGLIGTPASGPESWSDLAHGRGPVIIMVHGFRFAPGASKHCPHGHILALDPTRSCRRAVSWPRGLGFGAGDPEEGLGIAFGWPARGSPGRVWRRAEATGHGLAALVDEIALHAPHRPVHAIGHSMGARVVLSAMRHMRRGRLSGAILLAPAEYRETARAALAAPQAAGTELITVTSSENLVFDLAMAALLKPARRGDLPLAWGRDTPGTVIRLDDPAQLARLAGLGFALAAPEGRVSHWSVYLRPGAMALYAALLRRPAALPLARLAPAAGARMADTGVTPAPLSAA